MNYTPNGKAATDRTSTSLIFARRWSVLRSLRPDPETEGRLERATQPAQHSRIHYRMERVLYR
jgi:hypothetical protein